MYPKPFKKIIQAPSTKFTHTFNRPVRSPANFTPWELDKNEYPAASKLQDVFSHHNYSSNPNMNPNYFSDSVLDIPDIEAYTEIVTKQGFIDGRIPDDEVIEKIEKAEEEEVKHIKVVMTQRSNSITHDNIPPQTDYTTNVQTQQSDLGVKANKQAKTLQNNGEKTLPTVRTERKRHVSRHSTDFKSKASCIALGSTRSHLRNSSLTKEIAELKAELLQEREKTPPKKQKESLLKLDRTISGNQVPSDKVIELSSMFGVEASAVINERKKLIKENVVLKAVENIKEKKDKGHRSSQLLPALAVLNNGHSSRRIYQSVERDNTKRETTELPKSQIPATVKLANPVKEAKERTNAYFSVERERPPMHSRARSRELKTVTLSLENKGAEQASELLREKTPAHQRQQHPSPPPQQQNSERFYLYRINMLSSRLNPGVAKTFDDIGMRASEARGSLEPIYKEPSVERIKRIEGEGSPDNSGDLSPKPGVNKGMSIMSLKLWKKQMESVARPIFFGPNKVPVYMNEKKKFLPTEVINGFPGGKKIKHMRGKKELRPTFSTQHL